MQCRACRTYDCNEAMDMSYIIPKDGKTLYDYFNACTQLQATSDDDLPKFLCINCTQSLRQAYRFRQEAHVSDKELKRILLESPKNEIPVLKFDPTEQLRVAQTLVPRSGVKRENPPKLNARKRSMNIGSWIDYQAKKARNTGAVGVGRKGKLINPRIIKTGCDDPQLGKKCRLECHMRIDHGDREYAHKLFWGLGDRTKQWECINNWVTLKRKQSLSTEHKGSKAEDLEKKQLLRTEHKGLKSEDFEETEQERRKQHTFKLPKKDGGGKAIVCRNMFLRTLDISYQWVRTAREKKLKQNETGIIEPDNRGKHIENRPFRYSDEMLAEVRAHIESFPVVTSHFCQENTSRQYLEEHLSLRKMFELYKEKMGSQNKSAVTKNKYEYIFKTEYNYSFFRPKKHRCEQCERYKNYNIEEKLEHILEYETHINNTSFAKTDE